MGIASLLVANNIARGRAAANAGTVAGLLGQAPTSGGELGPGGFGPPAPAGVGGQGLLADVSDPARQATFAAGLLSAPGLEQSGSSLLQGVFSNTGAMDRQRSANMAAEARNFETLSGRSSDAQAARAQQERQFQQDFQRKLQVDAANARNDQLGKPATGFARLPDPMSPMGFSDVMVPGAEPFQKAQGAAIETRNLVGTVDDMISQITSADGPEAFGEIAGKLKGQYSAVISALLKLRGFGAPQAAEFERLEDALADPASFSAASWRAKSKILGGYLELRDELGRSYQMQQAVAGRAPIPELQGALGDAPVMVSGELERVDRATLDERARVTRRTAPAPISGGDDPVFGLFGGGGG